MAYKTFTNGSPLPASDLMTYLMNQSVMVFANSTARSAALTAPTEGMVTYLEDTNKLEVRVGSAWVVFNSPITTQGDLIVGDGSGLPSRLGIGANGQVLTSDGTTASWQDAGGGATAWTQLFNSTLPTGATTATISSLSGYDNYAVYFDGISTNAGADYNIQFGINSTRGNHNVFLRFMQNSSGTIFRDTGNINLASISTGSYSASGFVRISNGSTTGLSHVSYHGASNSISSADDRAFVGQGIVSKNTAVLSSITFYSSSGNFDAGSVIVWGA